MKQIVRINLTNKCNMSCGTCVISANPYNNGFMKFSDFQNILCQHRVIPLEIVLEGGEPFLHPHLNLFLEYLSTISNFKKVIIGTNGILINDNYETLVSTIDRLHINVQLNVAITSHLLKHNENHLSMCKSLLSETKFLVMFDVIFTSEEDKAYLSKVLEENNIPLERCYFSIVRSYGALKDTEYPKLNCYHCYDFVCYASDGKFFGSDLAKRAEYELSLCLNEIPIFDVVNHRNMWLTTQSFMADISFEKQDNIEETVRNVQREYIQIHSPNMKECSYIQEYINKSSNSPVVPANPTLIEREVLGLSKMMEITPSMERFYHYKNLAMKLCYDIAHFLVKENVKTTEDNYCKH